MFSESNLKNDKSINVDLPFIYLKNVVVNLHIGFKTKVSC